MHIVYKTFKPYLRDAINKKWRKILFSPKVISTERNSALWELQFKWVKTGKRTVFQYRDYVQRHSTSSGILKCSCGRKTCHYLYYMTVFTRAWSKNLARVPTLKLNMCRNKKDCRIHGRAYEKNSTVTRALHQNTCARPSSFFCLTRRHETVLNYNLTEMEGNLNKYEFISVLKCNYQATWCLNWERK